MVVLLCIALPMRAEPTDVAALEVARGEQGLLLSAQVRFELPSPVEDALLKGIPMVFVAEATVLRERWYWYDKEVAHAERYMRLSYQPLTRRWRLQAASGPISTSGLSLGQNFETQEEALGAVQRIANWRISEPGEVDADARHLVVLRFRLDVSQLPRPFQIGVVGQSDWSISAVRAVRLSPEPAK